MHSPKFPHTRKELEEIFAVDHLKRIYRDNLKKQLNEQGIFDPINFRDYEERLEVVCGEIREKVLASTYQPKRPKHYLVEKSRGLCRQMTCVQLSDAIVLEALSRRLHTEIEASKPVDSAYFMPDDGRFRTSWEKVNSAYGSSLGSWKRFQTATFGFADENRFIVIADIANFYDFIDFRSLRNILAALVNGASESALDLLLFTLNGLSWRPDFMPPSEVGMPQINLTAPRVLANAMLFELDMVAQSMALENYARFMDDIDVGVDSIAHAKRVIREIDLTLQSRKLRLNSSKTKILTAKDAHHHFCIDENAFLERFQKALKNKRANRFRPVLERILSKRYSEWSGNAVNPQVKGISEVCRFRTGNGSKLLKWVLGIQRSEFRQSINANHLIWIIRNEPSIREVAFYTLPVAQTSKCRAFRQISAMIMQGHFVDDQALLSFSEFMFQTRFPFSLQFRSEVIVLRNKFLENRSVGAICWLKIACKFATNAELLDSIRVIAASDHIDVATSRMIAACAPRFLQTADFGNFNDEISLLNREEADSVLNFILNLARDDSSLRRQQTFLNAQNPSLPQEVTFQKYLMILALKGGPQKSRFHQLLKRHTAFKLDPFLRANMY